MSSLNEAISAMVDYSLGDVYTSIPGRVVAVDWNNGCVDVQPITDAKDQEGVYTARPVIAAVPLMFPSSDDSVVSFPVKVGSTVLLVFSMRGMDVFKTNGGSETTDYRMHDIRDAIAIPGLYPRSKARTNLGQSPDSFTILHNVQSSPVKIEIKNNGDVTVDTTGKFVVNSPTIEMNGHVQIVGGLEIDGIEFDEHGHRYFNGVSAAFTEPPVNL